MKPSVPQHRRREPRTLDDHVPRGVWIALGVIFSLILWIGAYFVVFTEWGPFR